MPKTFTWGVEPEAADRDAIAKLADQQITASRLRAGTMNDLMRSLFTLAGTRQPGAAGRHLQLSGQDLDEVIAFGRRTIAATVTNSRTASLTWLGPLTLQVAEHGDGSPEPAEPISASEGS